MAERRPDGPRFLAWGLAALGALSSGPLLATWTTVDAGRGAVALQVPAGFDPSHPAPLLVLLHGYGSNGAEEESYLALASRLDAAGFLYALPNGTTNPTGSRFWNATDACCDIFGSNVDDSGYLDHLVDTIDAAYPVDPNRLFFFGHSNGAFMSYRMACDHADRITAIASLAGATYDNAGDCVPLRPVRTVEIHGTSDGTISYDGGLLLAPYPGAEQSASTWAEYDGCSSITTADPPFDAVATLAGDETSVLRYATGCHGPGAELWTMAGAVHTPSFTAEFRDRIVAWFVAAGDFLFRDDFEAANLEAWSASAP